MKRCTLLGFCTVFLWGISPLSRAADNNWINASGGSWETPANWSLGHVPQAASNDTPQIGVSGTYTVTVGSSAANTVPETFTNVNFLVTSFGSGTPTVEFTYTNAQTFRVNTSFDIGNGIVNWNAPNGTLNPNFIGVDQAFNGSGTLNVLSGFILTPDMRMGGGAGRIGFATISTNSTLRFTSNLEVGSGGGGAGFININGGTLLWDNDGYIGENNNATGQVVVAGGSFIQNASNGHQIEIGGARTVSSGGTLGRMIVSDGNWSSIGFVYVGAGNNTRGEFNVYGGTLTNVTRPFSVGEGTTSTGSVLIAGSGANWTARSLWSVGTGANSLGTVTMSNGTFHIFDSNVHIQLGNGSGSRGEWNMAGGTVLLDNIGGAFSPSMQVGAASSATGSLHVTGGLLEIDGVGNGLSIATAAGSTGSAVLDGGRVALRVLNVGSGGVLSNRTGGVLQFLGQDTVSGAGAKIVDGGTLSYSDYSALDVTNTVSKFNVVSGSILQLDSSTNVNITGTYTLANSSGNFKELSLTGNGPRWQSDSLQVGTGTRLFVSNAVGARASSVITDLGTIQVQNSTMTYEKAVTINGRYISDPSTNTFSDDATVGISGTLEGGAGDLFDFKKSLFIQSTNNQQFNLALSTVSFTGGGNHTNAVTGGDFGTNNFPSANFAYGKLELGSSTDQLYFISGGATNDDANANALYVDNLILGSNDTNLVANLHSPFNIYYMISVNQPANSYLNDQTYSLDGGGFLMPVIPEPTTSFLFAIGLGAMFLRRRSH